MIDPERYCLGLLAGEMGEAADVVGNALRFGLTTPERDATAADRLARECGDALAAIDFAVMHGLIDVGAVMERRLSKRRKLLDPNAVDNLGRRLAPAPPPGFAGFLPQSPEAAIRGDQVRR